MKNVVFEIWERVVVHACNHSTQETEAGGLQVEFQLELHSEFQASVDPISKKTRKKHKSPSTK